VIPRGGREPTSGRAEGVSNGLSGEVKMRIFQEVVEEDDEFAHDGGERDFLGFAGGDQPLIKRFQDRIEGRAEGVRPSRRGQAEPKGSGCFIPDRRIAYG